MIRRNLFKALAAGGALSFLAAGKAAGSGAPPPRVPSGRIDARLQELGITLPEVAPPVASYVPFRRVGNPVCTAG